MNQRDIFEQWAAHYDRSVIEIAQSDSFPFAGYDLVLDAIRNEGESESSVLELGTGTGNLARRILDHDCRVWATDFSSTMLEKAREKIPEATLVEHDLQSAWPQSIVGPFDRIVSAYVLHEFDLPTKLSILQQAPKHLARYGKIVIGDIAFPARAEFDNAKVKWHDSWDHSEHYWIAEEANAAANRVGLIGHWTQVSHCAGVFTFVPVKMCP